MPSPPAPRSPRPAPPLDPQILELPEVYTEILHKLFVDGVSAETIRKYEADFRYLQAWKRLSFDADLAFPEDEMVVLRFVLDHSLDLSLNEAPAEPKAIAQALIDQGLRKDLRRPAKSTLNRRISNWRSFHRWREVTSPFDAPSIKRVLRASRQSDDRIQPHLSPNAIRAQELDALISVTGPGMRGLRDRALLELGWGSGGRRRSEIAGLRYEDLDLSKFHAEGVIWIQLRRTKTHQDNPPDPLPLRGRSAKALVAWLDMAAIRSGPVFRKVSIERIVRDEAVRLGSVQDRPLTGEGIRKIIVRLVEEAKVRGKLPKSYTATPHGLRSGYLTEAARRRIPLEVARAHTLHRSREQAARYYHEVEMDQSEAARMRD